MVSIIRGAVSLFCWMLMAPLFGQNGMSLAIFEYPEPIVFSSEKDFRSGVSTHLTLAFNIPKKNDVWDNNWELSVSADGNLSSGSHTIPVSSISARVITRGNTFLRSTKTVFLSSRYQSIARNKPNFPASKTHFVEVELKSKNGKDFLKPAGDYSTYLSFTLTLD